MSDTTPITNSEDIIDSREIIARIEHLRASWDEATEDDHTDYVLSEDDWAVGLGEEEAAELTALTELAAEAPSEDWQYGATLIRDSYFETYAQELAEDIGAVPQDTSWPAYCIDWERAARDLRMDYSAVDFDGVTYWVR